jgi:glycosyltransferase involved in cell wall biosynthesis
MKVIHIVDDYGSGVGVFIEMLRKGITEFEHTIFCNYEFNKNDSSKLSNSEFILWKSIKAGEISVIRDFQAAIELYSFLNKNHFDIIHLHSSKAGFLGRVVAFFLKKTQKVIYTPHGAPFARVDVSSFKRSMFILIEKIGNLLGGKIVAVSKSESQLYGQHNMKCTFINNGVDYRNLNSKIDKSSTNHSSDISNSDLISTSGRFCAQKNPAEFIHIAHSFVAQKNVTFTWIGINSKGSRLENYDLPPNFHLTGWLAKDEVLSIIDQSKIYLSTALWEGLPFAVLEAMALSKPLILRDCTGNRDLVEHGKNGYLFNSTEDAVFYLKHLIDNNELCIKMGEHSKSMILDSFSSENTISRYMMLYKSTMTF